MKFKMLFVTLGLGGLVVVLAVLLSQVRQGAPRFEAWPPTVLTRPCTDASLYLDQRLALDQDLAGAAATLIQAWREQGWEAAADLHSSGQSAALTAHRGAQSFEAILTFEDGTFHLVAKGVQTCVMGNRS